MIKYMLVSLAMFGFVSISNAQELEAWEVELATWTKDAPEMNSGLLTLYWAQHLTSAVVICGVSEATVIAAVAADTVPVGNLLSEILANTVDEDYQSLSNNTPMGDAAQGALGGAGALVIDTVQYLFLALSGDTDQAWNDVSGAYESSRAVAEKMRQDSALCTRASRVELLIRKELFGRLWGQESVELQKPLDPAVQVTLP